MSSCVGAVVAVLGIVLGWLLAVAGSTAAFGSVAIPASAPAAGRATPARGAWLASAPSGPRTSSPPTPTLPSDYTPVPSPMRICDTRPGNPSASPAHRGSALARPQEPEDLGRPPLPSRYPPRARGFQQGDRSQRERHSSRPGLERLPHRLPRRRTAAARAEPQRPDRRNDLESCSGRSR